MSRWDNRTHTKSQPTAAIGDAPCRHELQHQVDRQPPPMTADPRPIKRQATSRLPNVERPLPLRNRPPMKSNCDLWRMVPTATDVPV